MDTVPPIFDFQLHHEMGIMMGSSILLCATINYIIIFFIIYYDHSFPTHTTQQHIFFLLLFLYIIIYYYYYPSTSSFLLTKIITTTEREEGINNKNTHSTLLYQRMYFKINIRYLRYFVYQDTYFSTSDLCLSPAVLIGSEPSNIHYQSYRELDYDWRPLVCCTYLTTTSPSRYMNRVE